MGDLVINWRWVVFMLWIFGSGLSMAAPCRPCSTKPNLFQQAGKHLTTIWTEGKTELYIPAYAWHNRFSYDKDRIGRYNENPWGAGLGKTYATEKGNLHGLYALAFLDSHKYLEPVLGYLYLKGFKIYEDVQAGAGFTVLVTQRPDINNGIPFPGVLPWGSIGYKRVSVAAAYIPGSHNIGNVLFVIAKVMLG